MIHSTDTLEKDVSEIRSNELKDTSFILYGMTL